MTNKFDLKTQMLKTGTASIVTNIGGAIATGKTRFLTYIRVERIDGLRIGSDFTNIEFAVVSRATGAPEDYATLISHGKLLIKMASVTTTGTVVYPTKGLLRAEVRGSINEPILSVAGPTYMIIAKQDLCQSASVFMQYYDE